MAVRSYQLTLAAAAQRLSNVYGGASLGNVINPKDDIPYREIQFQTTGADAFLGMDSAVDSTTYGTKVDSAVDGMTIKFGAYTTGPLKFSDFWVAGSGAVLHVSGIPF